MRIAAVRIAHVALWTGDLDRLCAFWAQTFGASVGDLYESRNQPGFTSRFLKLPGGAALEVMAAPWVQPRPDDTPRHGYAHLAIAVGSEAEVDRMAAAMQARGALVSGPRWTGDGFYEAVIRDPDGNPIEITA